MENKKIILIVEDDTSLRSALYEKLMSENFEVFVAKNGEEGVGVALSKHPDLILVDILMPKMNGIDMLKKIREDEWGKHALFIILTNVNQTDEISQAMKLAEVNNHEPFEYLIKANIKIEEVVKDIKRKLEI